MAFYVVFYFIFCIYCVESKTDIQKSISVESYNDLDPLESIAKCIKLISEKELYFRPTVVIDVQNIKDEDKGKKFIETVASVLMQNEVPMVIISNKTDNLLNKTSVFKNAEKYDHGLVITYFDSCDNLISLDFKSINRKTKKLIIISDECITKLREINYSVDKYDITFMFLDVSHGKSEMFSFLPVIDLHTCQQIIDKPIHINTCTNGSLLSQKIFPSKHLENFSQCPLKIGMTSWFPFSQIENETALEMYDHISDPAGLDIRILKIIAALFNASLDLHYIIGSKDESGNMEFIKLMQNGSLDVCAGGLYRIYGNSVAYSGVYANQAIVWIYSVERDDRSWKNLIGKLKDFYVFITCYVIYSIIYYIMCAFDGDAVTLSEIFLYSWGELIGANFSQRSRTLKQRILNLGYLVIGIHLSAYISIQMYSFLTIREPPQMLNTNDEIMDSGKTPFLIMNMKFFVTDDKYSDFANKSEDCTNFTDCVVKVLEHDGLTIVLQADVFNFQSTTAINGEARILRATENMLNVYNDMLIRKDIPILNQINKVMQTLFEAGITERLYSQAIGILSIAKAASANSNINKNSYSCKSGCSITLKQYAGIFYFWMFGCMLSAIVFIIELYLNNNK